VKTSNVAMTSFNLIIQHILLLLLLLLPPPPPPPPPPPLRNEVDNIIGVSLLIYSSQFMVFLVCKWLAYDMYQVKNAIVIILVLPLFPFTSLQ
jgi:hypothetical protein